MKKENVVYSRCVCTNTYMIAFILCAWSSGEGPVYAYAGADSLTNYARDLTIYIYIYIGEGPVYALTGLLTH